MPEVVEIDVARHGCVGDCKPVGEVFGGWRREHGCKYGDEDMMADRRAETRKCGVRLMSLMSTCRFAYVEVIEVLYAMPTFVINHVAVLPWWEKTLRRNRLESIRNLHLGIRMSFYPENSQKLLLADEMWKDMWKTVIRMKRLRNLQGTSFRCRSMFIFAISGRTKPDICRRRKSLRRPAQASFLRLLERVALNLEHQIVRLGFPCSISLPAEIELLAPLMEIRSVQNFDVLIGCSQYMIQQKEHVEPKPGSSDLPSMIYEDAPFRLIRFHRDRIEADRGILSPLGRWPLPSLVNGGLR